MRHWAIAAAAVLFLGQTATGAMSPFKADLIYDPDTGLVQLDQSEPEGEYYVDSFVLKTDDLPGFVFTNPDDDVLLAYLFMDPPTTTHLEISQTNAEPGLAPGFTFHTNDVFDLGFVFPKSMSQTELGNFLSQATYNDGEEFDLVPEPLTGAALLVGGAVLAGVRRRRRRRRPA